MGQLKYTATKKGGFWAPDPNPVTANDAFVLSAMNEKDGMHPRTLTIVAAGAGGSVAVRGWARGDAAPPGPGAGVPMGQLKQDGTISTGAVPTPCITRVDATGVDVEIAVVHGGNDIELQIIPTL